ncbi:hypothetical protein EKI60_03350 [Candidatus Saccharibacteria bacterium]|nr:MAG: hypothetical protein EKI60_03350 [Candidatus Saccharibacteria bacterium]
MSKHTTDRHTDDDNQLEQRGFRGGFMRRGIGLPIAAASIALLGSGCASPAAEKAAAAETQIIAEMRQGEEGFKVADISFVARAGVRFHTYPHKDSTGEKGNNSGNIAFTINSGTELHAASPLVYVDHNNEQWFGVMDPRGNPDDDTDHSGLVWMKEEVIGQTDGQGKEYVSMTPGESYEEPMEEWSSAVLGDHGYEAAAGGVVAVAFVTEAGQ